MGQPLGMPKNVDHIGDNKQVEQMKPQLQASRHGDLKLPVQYSQVNVLDLYQSDLQIFWRGKEFNWQLVLARKML